MFQKKNIYIYISKKPFLSEFSYTDVRLTDQNSEPLEIENKINITLLFN